MFFSLYACKKKETNAPTTNSTGASAAPVITKNATFKITGNHSGKLMVVTTNNQGFNDTDTISSLPWTKYVEYNSTVGGVGIGGNTILNFFAVPGQTIAVQILYNNTVVKSGTVAVGTNSVVNLPPLAYVFPI